MRAFTDCSSVAANALMNLNHRSAEQLEVLIELQTEISELSRDRNDENWRTATNGLGLSYLDGRSTMRSAPRSGQPTSNGPSAT